ncbi:ubiquitin-protein ligase E3A-like [Hydra vulgaris]|uniref:HECT-type E3 ubiquitin transferase n=1 Tax=Hydra vulgaris TaxID=6087 RepID=A0ABM4CK34_HYDVU
MWFNAFCLESIVMFNLVGILLGLEIYNGIILDVHFPLLIYKKLLGYKVGLGDLREIQPTLSKSLDELLSYEGDVEQDFGLTFEVFHNLYGKEMRTELLTNGSQISVTNSNRESFVKLFVNLIINKSIENSFSAFKEGFFQVCHFPSISLFTAPELELLICGSPDLDFKALEKVTEYKDGFSKSHPLMLEFWDIVHRFPFKQKQALLMFVTGSYRVPLKGLGSMAFYIQRNGPDSLNLPTSI